MHCSNCAKTVYVIYALVLWAIAIGTLGGSASAQQVTPREAAEQFYESLARHYGPVIHQGAASDQDYITALDFDGDWIGNNNWENQPTFTTQSSNRKRIGFFSTPYSIPEIIPTRTVPPAEGATRTIWNLFN